jgi:hypothetical protein
MSLYTFQGQPPQPLPERVRLANGLTRTDSTSYSLEEIAEWGFTGPIEIPVYSPDTEAIDWSSDDLAYIVRPLSEDELKARLRERANYNAFYNALLTSAVYQTIRQQAVASLELAVACTEFIAAITDAKLGRPNEAAFQACIDNIISATVLDEEDLGDLLTLMTESGLAGLYALAPL